MELTQIRAEQRFQCLKQHSISYNFHVSLEIGTHYHGLSELEFTLTSIPKQLAIDFKGTEIDALFVNNNESKVVLDEGFIMLDVNVLKQGMNTVGILYRNKYDNDGSGCCSFTDVDNKQYLYTQFQSYFANRVFPCFDQPDLKAKMSLNVITPMKKVLSNEYPTIQQEYSALTYTEKVKTSHGTLLQKYLKYQQQMKNNKMIVFPPTKLISTYLYCFVAGQYCQLKLPTQQTYNNIPMSLYCIESLYQYMQNMAPFFFQITIESLKFYEQFFGYKFPWEKYDQIFAHQYKWGAMQNAGIVTFNDIYLWKQKVSTERMLSLANTITHEMSHHWFGNLVTMKWWDDVWLNESFADFISHYCLQKIKDKCKTIQYESSMASFFNRKGWGYHQDQMITTHPIRGPVPNTSIADSIFDGITYSKGAATMKQLMFIISEEKFSAALSQYFKKYQWKNATLQNFVDQMKKYFDETEINLDEWKHLWLEKASLNQIEAEWDPKNTSQQAQLKIKQIYVSQEHKTLRPHMIKIGLFKEDYTIDEMKVLVKPTAQTIVHYNGTKQYKAILLNFEDHTFVKNIIDEVSLEYFTKNLKNISDILSRSLIWRSFFEMVKDAKMISNKYIEIIIKALSDEISDSIFQRQLGYCDAVISTYTPIPYRQKLYNQMFQYTLSLLPKFSNNQNRLVILKSHLISFARSDQNKSILIQWKNQTYQPLKNHQMTLMQKWSTVIKAFTMNSLSSEEKQKMFEEQHKNDPSDTAKLKRLTCDALKANKEEFDKIYQNFKDKNNDSSVTTKQAIAKGWNHPIHKEWLLQYKPKYFTDINEVHKDLKGDHFEAFYELLQPIDDDLQGQITSYQHVQFPSGKLDKNSRDILKIIDNLKRRLKAYQLYQQEKPNL